jgi:hypothetical protein
LSNGPKRLGTINDHENDSKRLQNHVHINVTDIKDQLY